MVDKPTRVLIWPGTPEGAAECQAYIDWSMTAPPAWWLDGAPWMDPAEPRVDAYGQPWCPMCEYRPDFDEPAGGEALRPNAVIHDMVVYPEDV